MDEVVLRASLVDEASKPIEELGKTAEETAKKVEKSSKREASAAERAASDMEGAHKRIRKGYKNTEDAAAKAGSGGGKKFGSNMADAVRASGSKAAGAANSIAGKMGEALKGKALAIGTAAGAAIGGAIASAVMSETADIDLQIKTGTLGGKANKNMGESMDGEVAAVSSELYNRGFAEDQAGVNELVDSIARISGVWDEGVDGAAQFGAEVATISGAFGQEAMGLGQTIETMINEGMATNGSSALDMITKTMQDASPLVRDEILENVTEYSKHYAQLGISSEDMFGLILKGSESGVIGVDKMGDAMKELGLRAVSGSKESIGALDSIGLNGSKVMDDLAVGGDKGGKAFQDIVKGLEGIKDPSDRAQTAIALFGGPLEDLGTQNIPDFLDALSSGADGLKGWEGAAMDAAEAVENGPAQQFEVLKRAALNSFSAMGQEAMPLLMPLMDFMIQWAPVLGPVAVGIGAISIALGIVAGATAAWNAVLELNPTVRIVMAIIAVIALLVAGFLWAYDNVAWFRTGVDGAVNGAKAAFEGLVGFWNNSFMPVLQAVGGWFKTYLIDPIASLVGWIGTAVEKMGGLSGIMSSVGSFMSDPLGGVRGALGLDGGGVIPGYAPGVDSVPTMLSPGEAVLVPELTRALGADWIYDMNARFSGRSPGSPRPADGKGATVEAAHYAGGGIAPLSFGAQVLTFAGGGIAPGSPDGPPAYKVYGVPVPVVPEVSARSLASREYAGSMSGTGARETVREGDTFNVDVRIEGALAAGVTAAEIKAAVAAAIDEAKRREY